MAASAASESAKPSGSKTAAIRAALAAHPDKMPKELAEVMKADGWDITPQSISVVKSKLKAKPRRKARPRAATTTAAPTAAAPAAEKAVSTPPKAADAISFDSLKKAKDLAAQLGGIKEAKAAVAALSELLD
ncbi:MAG: hypothetical protein EA424_15405 [Planctomycetaceae bacterium]|nr:MAG: hypothetical protein EA424_15405 [Planctomycetaceae bacterium]